MDTLPMGSRIAVIACEQHSLISRRQLHDLKLSAKQIRTLVDAGRLESVLRDVFRVAGSAVTPEQPLAAAVLRCGPDSVASFRSGAALSGIDVPEGARAEVTVWGSAHPREAAIVVHRVSSPPAQCIRHGIPTTTPERTIIDLAGVLTAQQLEIAFESARQGRLVTVESASRALEQIGARGRRGAAARQSLLAHVSDEPPAESALEVLVARLLRQANLPKPQRQLEVEAFGRTYRLDFAWPAHALALECDGRKWHDFEHDRRRWSAISAATGYRIAWARVRDEPERLVEEIRRRVSRPVAARRERVGRAASTAG